LYCKDLQQSRFHLTTVACIQVGGEIQTIRSSLVNSLKGVSSRLLKKNHPELERFYWKGCLWSSCGGAPIDIIRQYIEQQGQ